MEGPPPNELKVDWGDGVSAVDRTMRAIVLMIGEAIEVLVRAGEERDDISIEADEDGVTLPAYVLLKGKRVFRVGFAPEVDGLVRIDGSWLDELLQTQAPMPKPPRKRTVWDVVFRRK